MPRSAGGRLFPTRLLCLQPPSGTHSFTPDLPAAFDDPRMRLKGETRLPLDRLGKARLFTRATRPFNLDDFGSSIVKLSVGDSDCAYFGIDLR
jgi:hypothetical protein